ncbi:MAG: hypothetical protein FWC79_06955 [Oscillospiraceae bacterium]|nr:hypothetical protein [Oscillospiraceae bacterium]
MLINREEIEQKYKNLIDMSKDIMFEVEDARHTTAHITDVVENTIKIIGLLPDNTELDVEACILSAYWHDVRKNSE